MSSGNKPARPTTSMFDTRTNALGFSGSSDPGETTITVARVLEGICDLFFD